jgi:hypothetical protein
MAWISTRRIASINTAMENGYDIPLLSLTSLSPKSILTTPQVYAEVTASISAVTAALYLIPFVSRIPFLFAWDLILFILWIAVFGIFGKMYIGTRADDYGIQRMKNAVWVDLVNALLWLISACGMLVYWVKHRNNKTRFTGRATV